MIKLLLLAILGFLGYTLFVSFLRSFGRPRKKGPMPGSTPGGEEMVKDPVCGTYIPRSEAVELRAKGEQLHFCSKECRNRYLEGD